MKDVLDIKSIIVDGAKYTLSGTVKATNAGTYKAPENKASTESSNNTPTIPTGMVAKITYHASLL